jgi:flagellar motor switch protein FliM
MGAEEHESAAAASWLQGASPDGGGLSIERMPGLAYALEQFSLGVADMLAPFCKASSAGAVDELRSTHIFQFLGESEGLTAAVLNCASFDARMLMIFDDRIADTVVAAVFAASGGVSAPARSRSTKTAVETALVAEFARHLAKALAKGFEQSGGLDLTFERLETLADIYTLGRRDMPAIAARVTVETPGGSAPLTLLFPQSLLLPVRKNLTFDPGSEAPSSDPRWMRELEEGVTKTPIAVTAILEEFETSLGDVADFAVGQVLTLQGGGMGRVRLECAGREIFWCKLGEEDGRYSLEVEEAIVREDEHAEPARIH